MGIGSWILVGLGGFLLLVALYDLFQRKHAILRNFPVIGRLRYILESVGPELRQYIVTDNDSERPFNRDERRWVYASSKKENNYFGFGSDNSIDLLPNYLVIKHSAFPFAAHGQVHGEKQPVLIPCSKVCGAARGRAKAFRPDSTVYISAMSFGSLSAAAVESLNKGAAMAKCLHNTGEGSISSRCSPTPPACP